MPALVARVKSSSTATAASSDAAVARSCIPDLSVCVNLLSSLRTPSQKSPQMALFWQQDQKSDSVRGLGVVGRKLLFLRVVAVLSVAIATGHFVQSSRPSGLAAELTSLGTVENSGLAQPGGSGFGLPLLSDITPVAGTVAAAGHDGCAVTLSLAPAPGAMIDLFLSAPCNLGERVVVRHSGLSFSAIVGAEGQLRLQLPALETDALVATYLESSEIVLAKVKVPEAAIYFRFAVQMPFPSQFDLRAREGEQVYVAGKVGADGGPRRILGLGMVKSANPLLSQIYSILKADFSVPELTVELRISGETCGKTLPAETILSNGGTISRLRFDVAVPPCGASGDILLLKNLLADLTLAVPE